MGVKFYRGPEENYNSTTQEDGIYFTTDREGVNTIYMNGKLYGQVLEAGEGVAITNNAIKTIGIPYGVCDSTSTSTAFTVTVPGIDRLEDGVCCLVKNNKVTSAEGFTLNVNGLGAKPSYSNMATGNPVTPTDPTRDTTIFNINYAMLFIYSESLVEGGAWICYRGYDANTNTIGYQLRHNSSTLPASDKFYRYRLLFTSADGTKYVPANTSSSTNATAARTVNQRPIDPFGEILYYGTTSAVNAGSNPGADKLWEEYTLTLGYSFNRTGAALVLQYPKPVYIKCAPQSDGSAIIDSTTPYVQALPSTADGKIYIFLGIAYAATTIELLPTHPVYYHDGTGIRMWTGKTNPDLSKGTTSGSGNAVTDISVSGHEITLTKGKTFLESETDPVFTASAAHGISSSDISNWNNKASINVYEIRDKSGGGVEAINSGIYDLIFGNIGENYDEVKLLYNDEYYDLAYDDSSSTLKFTNNTDNKSKVLTVTNDDEVTYSEFTAGTLTSHLSIKTLNTNNTGSSLSGISSEAIAGSGTINLHKISKTGSYDDLENKPTINTNTGEALSVNSSETLSGNITLHKISKTGNYDDLLNKPDLTLKANLASPTFTGTPAAPTATVGTNTTLIATTAFVLNAINGLPSPMVFKGSLGTGGTITALPIDGSATIGDTYKVITAGTYASVSADVGDTFICKTKDTNANTWELIPSGDEPDGTVTSVGLSMPTGFSVSNSPIADSGTIGVTFADGYSLPTTSKQTEWDNKVSSVKSIKSDNTSAQSTSSSETISGSGTINLHKIAKTGTYSDLIGKPTIPEQMKVGSVAGKLYRNNVGGTGNFSISGNSGCIPNLTAGTFLVSIYAKSSTQSYTFRFNFGSGNTYDLSTTNGEINDLRTITISSAATFSGSVVTSSGVSSGTILYVVMYNYLTPIQTVGPAAVTNRYADLDGTPSLASVATSGSYNDLSNKPTIPTVNNATLTIQKNGTNVNTFTANASSNVTANIQVAEPIIIEVTGSGTNDSPYAIDGTPYSDVTTALDNDSNASIWLLFEGKYYVFNKDDGSHSVSFVYVDTDGTISKFTIEADDSIIHSTFSSQSALVSGTSIKTINSTSLLGSGNIALQTPLTFDSTPTALSNNPVTSAGINSALSGKKDKSIELLSTYGDLFSAISSATEEDPATLTTAQQALYDDLVSKYGVKDFTFWTVPVFTNADSYTLTGNMTFDSYHIGNNDTISVSINKTSGANTYWLVVENTSWQTALTFDNAPTSSSTNPVTSGGVYTALSNKQDILTFDNSPTANSNNVVKSGGVYTAIQDATEFYKIPSADVNTLIWVSFFHEIENQTALNNACEAILTALKNNKKIDLDYSEGIDVTNIISLLSYYYENTGEDTTVQLTCFFNSTTLMTMTLTKDSSTSNWNASMGSRTLVPSVQGDGNAITGVNTTDGQFILNKGKTFLESESDPVFTASAAYGITSSNISTWNGKQDALVSGTSIKTVNSTSLLGSGNIDADDVVHGMLTENGFRTDGEWANSGGTWTYVVPLNGSVVTPNENKIYVDVTTNRIYRWKGSYVQIGGGDDVEMTTAEVDTMMTDE